MKKRSAAIVTALAALPLLPALTSARPHRDNKTRKDDIVEQLHGVAISDPYRWLEDGASPEVESWTDGQNAATRRELDKFSGRGELERRLWQLYEIGSLGVPVSRPGPKNVGRRYLYTRRDGKQNQPVLYVRDGVAGNDRTLIDVNQDRTDGTRALDWWYPSDDGAHVAYGVSDDGSEESTLRVRDVATGRDLGDEIKFTRHCSLAWMPDGRGFYYTRYPVPGQVPAGDERYHRAVYRHRLGDEVAKDRKLFGDGRDKTDWPNVDLSPDGRWLAITVNQGWSKAEIYLLDQKAAGAPIPVAVGEAALFRIIEALNDRLYVFSTSGAPRGRVFAVDPTKPDRARWREVIKESDEVLESVGYFRGGLVATTLADAAARMRLYTPDGAPRREVALPELGTVTGLSVSRDTSEIFYGFNSFVMPTSVYRLADAASDAAPPPAPDLWRRLAAPVDPTAFEVARVMVTSRDGSRAPLFLVSRKPGARGRSGFARPSPSRGAWDPPRVPQLNDGSRPAVLTGYGGFDVSRLPEWTPSAIPFLESGGTFALAVLRGGGEYGEAWHQAGMLGRKQNVFDDFIAAAQWMIDNRVTRPDRLAISGRSNGGLLVGAALTQRPDLFRAVVCGVPLLDMIRYDRFRLAALWVPEYGSPADPEAFKWLSAYSPYHRVKDGVRYPAVLLHTASSDTRVDPMHARKMAARLQAATKSKLPVLLRLESKAGHGAGKPLAKVIAQTADEWTFVFSQLKVSIRRP